MRFFSSEKSSSEPPNHRKALGLASASDARVGKSQGQVARRGRLAGRWVRGVRSRTRTYRQTCPDLGTVARPGMACVLCWLAGRLVSPPSAVRLIRPGCRMAEPGWLVAWLYARSGWCRRTDGTTHDERVPIPRRHPASPTDRLIGTLIRLGKSERPVSLRCYLLYPVRTSAIFDL